jgi:hypothetical protein
MWDPCDNVSVCRVVRSAWLPLAVKVKAGGLAEVLPARIFCISTICSVCLRVQGVSKLLKLLLSRAQPKRVGVAPVTGAMLAGLAEAYVAAINDGAVPTIATAWQVCLCERHGCLRQAGLRLQQYKVTGVRHHLVGAVMLWNTPMLLRRQLHRIWWIDGQSRSALRAACRLRC